MPSVCFQKEVDLSAEDLMAVIVDFASYPDFLPTIRKITIQLKGPPVWEVRFVTHLIRRLEYTLRLERHDGHRLSWSLLEGVFVRNSGAWELEPMKNGCRVTYRLTMQLDTYLPTAISRSLQQTSLPQTVEAFVREGKRRVTAHCKNDSDGD